MDVVKITLVIIIAVVITHTAILWGMVVPNLNGIEHKVLVEYPQRIDNIDDFVGKGDRFTLDDGHTLQQQIETMEEELSHLRKLVIKEIAKEVANDQE